MRSWGIAVGLAIMVVTETATLAGVEPFATWNTPIAWTGFILFADSVVYRARGRSWLRSSPREFVGLALVSIPLWVVFEGYNLLIRNWYYTGLPRSFWLRQFGFAWAFATIWPAMFEAAELVAVRRGNANGPDGGFNEASVGASRRADRRRSGMAVISVAAGAAMLVSPFLVPAEAARYMAAPVWLGFIFLIDPINRRLGLETITRERFVNLTLGGLLCGVLWELWNFWSAAKWHYSVPIMERVRIFEMPLPGYFGFPAFALECFTMYVLVRGAFASPGRAIAV
jgi:hypothetical protein